MSRKKEIEAYREAGLDQFQILATLDDQTCERCGKFDLAIFKIDQYQEGINAPPFHDSCRCTIIPYIKDEFTDNGERVARNPLTGKTYYVSGKMNWKTWKQSL